MKKALIGTAAIGGVAGFFLRRAQLTKSFDASGLIPSGDGISLALYLLCAAAVVIALVLCLREKKGSVPVFQEKMPLRGLAVIVAALGILAVNLPPDFQGGLFDKMILALGFASVCAMAVEGVFHMQGRPGSLLGGCILPLYLAELLIRDYRTWSYDPLLVEYAFQLLFSVFALLAAFELAAFRVGKGKRRLTGFYVACTVCMAGPALADGGARNILLIAALTLYLLAEYAPILRADPIEAVEEDAAQSAENETEMEDMQENSANYPSNMEGM